MIAIFLFLNCAFATTANILLKHSAIAVSMPAFIAFQIAGNLIGFAGILAYTGLLRKLPLHVAFPLTQGLAAIGILVFGSVLIFREAFSVKEGVGCALVIAGIVLIGLGSGKRGESRVGKGTDGGGEEEEC
jgi:multidrug transporter EmrE-like cation transporter